MQPIEECKQGSRLIGEGGGGVKQNEKVEGELRPGTVKNRRRGVLSESVGQVSRVNQLPSAILSGRVPASQAELDGLAAANQSRMKATRDCGAALAFITERLAKGSTVDHPLLGQVEKAMEMCKEFQFIMRTYCVAEDVGMPDRDEGLRNETADEIG